MRCFYQPKKHWLVSLILPQKIYIVSTIRSILGASNAYPQYVFVKKWNVYLILVLIRWYWNHFELCHGDISLREFHWVPTCFFFFFFCNIQQQTTNNNNNNNNNNKKTKQKKTTITTILYTFLLIFFSSYYSGCPVKVAVFTSGGVFVCSLLFVTF